MKKDKNTSTEAAELRHRAEARLRAAAMKSAPARTDADTQRLVHELQVHQIELEMQNEELRQSRAEVETGLERYTELYDFAPVGYLTLGRDGAIRQVNLTGARLLGVDRARLPGRRFGVFVGAPDRAGFKAFLEKVFASQAKEECEVALLKEGKGPLNVHITATVSQDALECRAMIEDITERKQVETDTKRLASFPMLNPRPIVEADLAGHVRFYNPVAEQMFPDLYQRGLEHPWLADWESVLRTLRKGGPKPIVREVHFDEKWYHQTLHLVEDGKYIRIYGADITARKKMEEALESSETRYRRLFEAAQDGILILDAETGQIVDVNPFLVEMLGYSIEELLGKKLWEIGTFINIEATKATSLELKSKGYVRYHDLPLETKEGRPIAVEFVSNVYLVNHIK